MKLIEEVFQHYKIKPTCRPFTIKDLTGFRNIPYSVLSSATTPDTILNYHEEVNKLLIEVIFTTICNVDGSEQDTDVVHKALHSLVYELTHRYNVVLDLDTEEKIRPLIDYLHALEIVLLNELPANFQEKMVIMSLPMETISDDLNCVCDIKADRLPGEEHYILNFVVMSSK